MDNKNLIVNQLTLDKVLIGQRIAEYRSYTGWTQYQLAKRIGTNSHTVESWEQCTSVPSLENVLKLCAVFHTTPNSLLGFGNKQVYILDDFLPADQELVAGILQLFWDRNSKKL